MPNPRIMLLDVESGRRRPMRAAVPLLSSAPKGWEGFLLEEFPAAGAESRNVMLLHPALFVCLGERSTLEWTSSGRTVSRSISRGQVSILPAHQPYSVKLRAPGSSVIVSLEQKLLTGAAVEQGQVEEVEAEWVHGADDGLARELALALRAEARQSESKNPCYAQSLAATLAAHVVRRYCSNKMQGAPDRTGGLTGLRLRRTVQFIQENLGEDLSIARLAAAAGLSSCHFARLFKESTGMAPHRYLIKCRIARARQLLLERSLSLAEVAQRAGFCDQGHLTRAFRQFLGTTPGAVAQRGSVFPAYP